MQNNSKHVRVLTNVSKIKIIIIIKKLHEEGRHRQEVVINLSNRDEKIDSYTIKKRASTSMNDVSIIKIKKTTKHAYTEVVINKQ